MSVARFIGDVKSFNYPVNVAALSHELPIPPDRETALSVKNFIASQTNIPADHLALSVSKGLQTTYYLTSQRPPRFETGVTRFLNDHDSIPEALKPLPNEETLETRKCYGEPALFYSVRKCEDLTHCPDLVRINTLFGYIGSVSITPAMTGHKLKEAIATKLGFDPDRQKLGYRTDPSSSAKTMDDDTPIGDLGIKHDSSISLVVKWKEDPVA